MNWNRLAYWLLKFVALAVGFAILAAVGYAALLLVSKGATLLWALPLKKIFCSGCVMAILFYTACVLRWVAKFFKARTQRLEDQ